MRLQTPISAIDHLNIVFMSS